MTDRMTGIAISLVIAASLSLTSCSAGGEGAETDAPVPISSQGAETTGGLSVVAIDFAFEPMTLSLAAGDSVRFENDGSVAHTFSVEDSEVDVHVDPGEQSEVSLAQVEPGEHTFYCKLHPGMQGTLTVT